MTKKSGHTVRLAFRGNKVIEAKNMDTGEMHTPEEFEADEDRHKAQRRALKKMGEHHG
jgi:hypothetical protein